MTDPKIDFEVLISFLASDFSIVIVGEKGVDGFHDSEYIGGFIHPSGDTAND